MRGFAHSFCRWGVFRFASRRPVVGFALLSWTFLTSACRRDLSLAGEADECARAAESSSIYQIPPADRVLPDLERDAGLPHVLETAFKSNGEIEAAYYDWRAAIERVPQAGALPDPRLDFGYLFNPANFTSFGGILLGTLESVRVMASQEVPVKGARKAQSELALAEARAAGERFNAAKLSLQTKAIQAYADLLLTRDLIGNTSETLRLLADTRQIALDHYHSVQMETAADIQKAELEIDRVESDRRMLAIASRSRAAALNGLLGRAPESPLGQLQWPAAKPRSADPIQLFERAAAGNPELAALRREIEAKGAAQALAELRRKPAFMIGGGLDDPLMPLLSASLTLSVNRERIRAGIEEALATRQAAEAKIRQAGADVNTRLIVALTGLEDAQRIADDVEGDLIPKVQEVLRTQQLQYGSGGGSFMGILDTERTVIELRRLPLQARADRLKALAELDEIAGGGLLDMPAGATAMTLREDKP